VRLKAAVLHDGEGGERWEAIDVQVDEGGKQSGWLHGIVQHTTEAGQDGPMTVDEKMTWVHGHEQKSRVAPESESSMVMGALTLRMDDMP